MKIFNPLILPLAAACLGSCSENVEQKPNILFISFDDLRPELGAYGADHIISPNIDRLASEGMVFNNAYCQQSVSGPSRASLMTGLRPDSTYVIDNEHHHRQTRPSVVTLPQHFVAHGYHAVNYGKVFHGHMGRFNDALSWSELWYYPPQNYTENLRGYLREDNIAHIIKSNGGGKTEFSASATEGEDVGDNDYPDGQTIEALLANMDKYEKMSRQGKPFFIALGIEKPHLPFVSPKKYWDLYNREDITLPEMDNYPEGSPLMAHMDDGELRAYTDIPAQGRVSHDKALELIHGYYASVSYVDNLIGKIIDDLKRRDLYDNTIIMLWGDHGWKLADFGGWSKSTIYETDARVPLIVRVPNLADKGEYSSSLVELVDMFPTLCELAGIPALDILQGDSFAPILKNKDAEVKQVAFTQFPRGTEQSLYSTHGKEYMGYSMRTDTHRYMRWIRRSTGEIVAEELYDLHDTNCEVVNIINQPIHAALADDMRALYDREIIRAYR